MFLRHTLTLASQLKRLAEAGHRRPTPNHTSPLPPTRQPIEAISLLSDLTATDSRPPPDLAPLGQNAGSPPPAVERPPIQVDVLDHATQVKRAVLIVDIAESVRLMQADENGTISRWLSLAGAVEHRLRTSNRGRVVKHLGDGLLIEFTEVMSAVETAFALQRASREANAALPPDRQLLLRVGIELGTVILRNGDVLGHAVNLAARLTSIARAGEIIVSAAVRENLTAAIDAGIEDLGDCYLRHVATPVRAYRIGPPGPHLKLASTIPLSELLPALAVIPFKGVGQGFDQDVLGEILADEIIMEMSRSTDVDVISRLSTTMFRGRGATPQEIRHHLNADYILSGTYRIAGGTLLLDTELAEARSGRIVWLKRLTGPWLELNTGESDLAGRIAAGVRSAIAVRELQCARSQPLPSLRCYTLLVAAVSLMHRLSLGDFEEAKRMLEVLIERSGRLAVPQAWLANWHVLRVQQGWSDNPKRDAQIALQSTAQALDSDANCSLALTIDGFVQTNLLKRLDVAEERYDAALEANPNESRAWLLRGTLHAFRAEGEAAVNETTRAIRLSPLDPHRYFYDSLAGTACLAAQQYDRALKLALCSLRANRKHTSTLRVKAIAEWRLGFCDDARDTVKELLRLEPNLTIREYLRRTPAADYPTGRDWAGALQAAGVPD